MKTAREIIAETIETPPVEMPTPDMVIARLAAEGFSIVETAAIDELADAAVELRGRFRSNTDEDWAASSRAHDAITAVRSRSTREGKTG